MTGTNGNPVAALAAFRAAASELIQAAAERRTPEYRLRCALAEADRLRQDMAAAATEAAAAAESADMAALVTEYAATCEIAWTTLAADAASAYAAETGACLPSHAGADGQLVTAYAAGWSAGADALDEGLTRPGGYGDDEWSAFAAGFAEGARYRLGAAMTALEQARARQARP